MANRLYYAIIDNEDKYYKIAKVNASSGDSTSCVVTKDDIMIELRKTKGIPVNFSIEKGNIVESAGSFKRLKGCPEVVVVLEEVQNGAGRTVRYLCVNKNGKVGYIPLNQILRKCMEVKKKGEQGNIQNFVLTQNMKFIQPKDGSRPYLSAYPNHQIPVKVVDISHKERLKEKKSLVETSKNKKSLRNVDDLFTKEQKKELLAAKKAGVNINIIGNPELSPEQMHVIWTNKAKGCRAELFADPGYDVECMEFLASIMLNDAINMKEVQPLLSRKYSAEHMLEIYMGIVNGVDFTKYMGYDNSAEMMRFKRQCMENEVDYM